MQKQGGFMGGEMLFLLAAMAIAVYGVYKYVSAETNDYNKLVERVQSLQGEIKVQDNKIEAQDKRIDNLAENINQLKIVVTEFRKVAEEAIEDVGDAQVHMAKMRESQIDLKDRSYPRTVELKLTAPTGAIPIEIYSRTPVRKKKVVTRTTKARTKTGGIVSRSETRVSPLKGDPDAVKKKRVRKKATKKKATKKRATRKKPRGNGKVIPATLPGLKESKRALAQAGV